MPRLYKVVFTGLLRSGFEKNTVLNNVVSLTKMDQNKAINLLKAGKPVVLKKGLERQKAEKFGGLFQKTGMQIKLIEQEEEPQEDQQFAFPKPTSNIPLEKRTRIKLRHEDNPYAAPESDIKVLNEISDEWLATPKKVPASHGFQWITMAFRMFLKEPWKWSAMGLIGLLIITPLQFIPLIGPFANIFLTMIFAGGIMLAAQRQFEGDDLQISYLFSGFNHNRNQLVLVGGFYLLSIIIFIVTIIVSFFLAIGSDIFSLLFDEKNNILAYLDSGPPILLYVLPIIFGTTFYFIMLMSLWFSTPLVALGDQTAIAAFKLSFRGCLKNFFPFLLYSFTYFLIGIVLILLFTATMFALQFLSDEGGFFISMFIPFIFTLVVMPPMMIITALSVYTGFRDIFHKSA